MCFKLQRVSIKIAPVLETEYFQSEQLIAHVDYSTMPTFRRLQVALPTHECYNIKLSTIFNAITSK